MRYLIITLIFVFSSVGFSQTTTENYVQSITPHSEVQTDTQLQNLNPFSKTQTITYYDGLGRPIQSIAKNAGGNGEDIITPILYDGFGRQTKEYLPYSRSSSSLNFIDTNTLISNIESQYLMKYPTELDANSPNPFSEKVLENSELNRVLEQAAPGEDWKYIELTNLSNPQSDHTVKFEYLANTLNPEGGNSLSDSAGNYYDNVRQFSVVHPSNNLESISLVFGGYYPSGELYKTVVKDENFVQLYEQNCPPNSPLCSNIPLRTVNNTTEEFTDKSGRTVLKRTYNDSQPHDTYYIYDDFGNLTYVLSPEGSEAIVNTLGVVNTDTLNKFCYQYVYDHRNRLIEKKVPGKAWEYIIYDVIDRPILSQDSNLRAMDQWLFTKYDDFNRVAYTGMLQLSSSLSRDELQHLITTGIDNGNYTLNEERSVKVTSVSSDITTELYYTNKAYPGYQQNIKIYTINYYDNHSNINLPSSLVYQNSFGQTLSSNNTGLATMNKVRTLDTNNWNNSAVYYDDKGRTIFLASESQYLNTEDWVKSNLDFTGNILESESSHRKTGQPDISINDVFIYDQAFRIKQHSQQVNGLNTEMIVDNTYDEYGQLIRKGVGGSANAPLQDVDYKYNIRGWLKSINDIEAIGSDLFTFKINYNNTEIVNSNPSSQSQPLFNGNISETLWQTAYDDDSNINFRGYIYQYDDLNRIKKAVYQRNGSSVQNGRFNLNLINYDKNGNITALNRTGKDDNGNYLNTIDKLIYSYDGNQLTDVKELENHNYGFIDAGNEQNGDYEYDSNGNLTRDRNKNITSISYNHLNLPTRVTTENGTIVYVYDATGIKQEKQVNEGRQPTITTRYAGLYIYKVEPATGEKLQFINQPEGYLEPFKSEFKYVYQYKDHLGNIRLSFKDDNDDYEGILDSDFEYSFNGWEEKGSVNYSLEDGRVKANVNSSWEGIRHYLNGGITTVAGETITIRVKFDKGNTTSKVRLYMPEKDPNGNHVNWNLINGDMQTGYGEYTFTPTTTGNTITSICIDKDNTNTSSNTHFYVDHVSLNIGELLILEENNYYPFGLKHKGYNNVVNGTDHPYGFGGKEEQDELGLAWIDITARNYDAALGRWMNIDPLAEQMRRHSPYNYAFDNPVYFMDPDGMKPCPGGDCPDPIEEFKNLVFDFFSDVGETIDNAVTELKDSFVLEASGSVDIGIQAGVKTKVAGAVDAKVNVNLVSIELVSGTVDFANLEDSDSISGDHIGKDGNIDVSHSASL